MSLHFFIHPKLGLVWIDPPFPNLVALKSQDVGAGKGNGLAITTTNVFGIHFYNHYVS
jgi:hypothetical protein